MFLDLILFKMKKFKSPQFLNLITSLLIFVLSFALMHSEAMSVECKTSSNNTSSCDVTTAKTQAIGKFTGSSALTVNFQADVTASANIVINVDATKASNIFTNTATITNTQTSNGKALYINKGGKINVLQNSGTFLATGTGTGNTGIHIYNGTLNTLQNSGTIRATNGYGLRLQGATSTVGAIQNSTSIYGLLNSGTITSIENSANILSSSTVEYGGNHKSVQHHTD